MTQAEFKEVKAKLRDYKTVELAAKHSRWSEKTVSRVKSSHSLKEYKEKCR